jgi:CRISPR-associated protein Cas1
MINLRELPKLRDSLSFIYIEYSKVECNSGAIVLFNKKGETNIPVASLGVIMLGPGTTISHEAVKILSESGCSFLWVGENGVRLYGQGIGETRSSARLLKQIKLYTDPTSHMSVVLKMYRKRFLEELPNNLSIEQIRGKEGVRVRTAYKDASSKYGVEWNGRNYDRKNWNKSDYINKALSTASSCLYGICHCAIVSTGYSPALGFIHTGRLLSFVYDIADLYRIDTIVPVAFEITGNCQKAECYGELERLVRIRCRNIFYEQKILDRIVNDIDEIMQIETSDFEKNKSDEEFNDPPSLLWEPKAEEIIEGVLL